MSAMSDNDRSDVLSQRAAGPSDPIVVALLYNTNGMATWCWEGAHALLESGRRVILIAGSDTPLPGTSSVEIIRIAIPERLPSHRSRVSGAISTAGRLVSSASDGLLELIHSDLRNRGISPAAYVLNQSTLVDIAVDCPQVVAAWSFPVSLLSYLQKTPLLVPDKSLRSYARASLSAWGWWRKDWRAYRAAQRVLPVTDAMRGSLEARSISTCLAYPGTFVGPLRPRLPGGIRLLIAAGNLGEPRKRIVWMLDAMKELRMPSGTVLLLAGEADNSIREAAAKIGFPSELLGRLRRQELQQVMQDAHIFCFGSLLDDWGYVLVEAMANGMVPVAPAINPFNEILKGVGWCYAPHKQAAFANAIQSTASGDLGEQGRLAWKRASLCFSRQAFAQSILNSLKTVGSGN